MIDIKVSSKIKITSDRKQFIIQERNKMTEGERAGEWTEFRATAYYSKIKHALQKVKELELATSNATSISSMIKQIEITDKKIEKAIEKLEEIQDSMRGPVGDIK